MTKKKNEYFHTNEDKNRGVAAYVATGSFSKAAQITGVPENTLRNWSKQDWFPEEVRRLDQVDTDEIKSTFTRIAKRATVDLEDRLENGDEVVTKDGEIVRKKIAGKDLAIISAVSVDKRKHLMEQPASISIQNTHEKLLNLMQQFIKFSNAKDITPEAPDDQRTLIEQNHPDSETNSSVSQTTGGEKPSASASPFEPYPDGPSHSGGSFGPSSPGSSGR